MPTLINHTPFPNFRYYTRGQGDREFGTIIVKATFAFDRTGRLVTAEEQAPMVFTDLCHGSTDSSSLWHPSDLVPPKPATDLIINAVARRPSERASPSWIVGVAIVDGATRRLEKALRVFGPRTWKPVWKRPLRDDQRSDWRTHRRHFRNWELSEAEPTDAVPLRYELAYGGEIEQGVDENGGLSFDLDHRNPIGRGKIDPHWSDHTAPVAAPQIEAHDAPVTEPYQSMRPEGLGPIPPAWLPRRPLGGTFDQEWKDKVWPAWPSDYDPAYHNSAHPDLQLTPHMNGAENIELRGLSAFTDALSFNLPGEELTVEFFTAEGDFARRDMVLDTVFLDIEAAEVNDWRVFLTWRTDFEPGTYDDAHILAKLASSDSIDAVLAESQEMA